MIEFNRPWEDADVTLFRQNVSRFMQEELEPGDEAARQQGHVGHAIWRKAGELGLLCTDIPDEYGGGGGDIRHEAVIGEELYRRSLTGMNIAVHSIVAHYLLNHGTSAQKQRWLSRMAQGELVGAIAMTEPGAGSDLQGVRLRATRDGDHYLLNGTKTFISNGFLAGLVLVVARTDVQAGAKGISIFAVETEGLAGYRVGRVLDKIGMKAQDTSELFFDDVRVPADCLLGGQEGKGFYQLMSDLSFERLLIGVNSLAMMEGAYEATLKYVRERQAFGKAIAEFQNTRFKLAEMATQIRVGRAFIDQCIELQLRGELDATTASMAKLWASEALGRCVDECVQLFGGYGYMNEYLIGRMYVDTRIQRIYGGTSEIMKEVIARAM
ncbi:acyl-CoA dehydrogenase family protein [Diaphorobacter aerolatus]|uniref:Acyl-CoA dehydrogenase family protein n=1 Tax=Diaphorobacter aerolatus TaxID=1288495 RepID=A0A7H0GJS0_9BURK|nr:acyl-CoA dehydrogenase family protein [Diaphorobacter aerolatus]QNP48536.1 acyl-CoA dehydrogenase family protein [Diaphorobacter aerolatus]